MIKMKMNIFHKEHNAHYKIAYDKQNANSTTREK